MFLVQLKAKESEDTHVSGPEKRGKSEDTHLSDPKECLNSLDMD